MKKTIIALIAIGVLVAGGAAAVFMSSNAATVPATTTSKPASSKSTEEIVTQLLSPSMKNAPALGNDSAKVTIVEFGDYQCTWCHRWHESTKDAVMTSFVDTGKARFLFKDYPINDLSDRASSKAAEASYCAADQGKYWQYHDETYNNWKGENPSPAWVTAASLKQFATNVGIKDMDAFSQCLDSGKYAGIVSDNYNLARSIGLDATPSFIVIADGQTPKLLRGAYPYSSFENVINGMTS
jgi:protein-disulfide isomerase